MARIRTIKPEFFTDSKVAKKQPIVRLFFAGLWVYADKEGRLEEDQDLLKLHLIPYDKQTVETCLLGLIPDQIIRYEVLGKRFIQIRHFKKHQRPHPKESESQIPPPSTEAIELNGKKLNLTAGTSGREGEQKGKEGKGTDVIAANPQDLMDLWNRCAQGDGVKLPRILKLSKERREKCAARLSENPLEFWEAVFSRMARTPFLNGKGKEGWIASFDWALANDQNAVKVMEGNYDERKNGNREIIGLAAGVELEEYDRNRNDPA